MITRWALMSIAQARLRDTTTTCNANSHKKTGFYMTRPIQGNEGSKRPPSSLIFHVLQRFPELSCGLPEWRQSWTAVLQSLFHLPTVPRVNKPHHNWQSPLKSGEETITLLSNLRNVPSFQNITIVFWKSQTGGKNINPSFSDNTYGETHLTISLPRSH